MKPLPEILVADDDEHDLTMIRGALAKVAGDKARISCVRDGAEALDFLYARGTYAARGADLPVIMMLDLHMPRVNGWEVLQQVKSDPALHAMPVVVFSSSARDADVRRCYDLGANAYVVKPIDFGEFERVLGATAAFWLRYNLLASAHKPAAAGSLPPPGGAAGTGKATPSRRRRLSAPRGGAR